MLMQVTLRPLPVRKKAQADVEQRGRADRNASATDDLQRHASDEKIPIREETSAQVTAKEVQAVVERAKHAHQRRGHFHREWRCFVA